MAKVMKKVEELAHYLARTTYEDLSAAAIKALKIRVLDSIGCAIGALSYHTTQNVKALIDEFGGAPLATLIGGGRTAPDRAALYNSALIRFLDFNDSFLAKKETCHPSDNVGAVLAAAEYASASGKQFLLALACAYQVQCRLSQIAPVRDKGFDHTTQGAYAVAAGVSKALGLDATKTAHALAIAGVANNALRVTRTGALSNWKGLAYPFTAFSATEAAFLAAKGITGPLEIFEGNKGFMHSIAGHFEMEWSADHLDDVLKTILKKYNAEIHSQSTLEGILELKQQHKIDPNAIQQINIDIFDVAFNIIGGGEEGAKKTIRTKEEADHSLPYMAAAALLDGQVMPAQYASERIARGDIQTLLQKIQICPSEQFSRRFPVEMCVQIVISMQNGAVYQIQKNDYEGFTSKPMEWEQALAKFRALTQPHLSEKLSTQIVETISQLDSREIKQLTDLLGAVYERLSF
jgi:2-methylcitrate dehydratase